MRRGRAGLAGIGALAGIASCAALALSVGCATEATRASEVGGAAEDGGVAGRLDASAAPPDAGSPEDAESPAATDAGALDAFVPQVAPRRWPASSEPAATHDVDTDLARVLERSNLAGACDAVAAGGADRATRLRCGKHMFFEETFGTVGVPFPLLKFLQEFYADTFFGPGFSWLGFVADPDDPDGMPIGLARTTARLGNVETRAFTCAACHFGQMPDGRYAVGFGNGALDYGMFIASLGAPLTLSFSPDSADVHPTLKALLGPAVEAAKMQRGYTLRAAAVGVELLGTSSSSVSAQLSVEEQGRFLSLRAGTMDFLTKPLLDDGVWTVSRILSLWNLPDEAQRRAAGMPHELLSWTGGVHDLRVFLEGFVAIGKSDAMGAWTPERLAPLAEYVWSLRTPPLLRTLDAAEVERGAALFVTKQCTTCHVGPSGEGSRPYGFEEIGTDPALREIFSPSMIPGGEPCCGLGGSSSYSVTGGVKAPRMVGVEGQRRFLHNGAIGSLEELFCLAPRDPRADLAETSVGHTMTCDGLDDGEKRALVTYLLSL